MKRNEEIFCPKCKARGKQLYGASNDNEVRFQCNICKYEWGQDTLMSFMSQKKNNNDPNICECGGKFEFERLDGRSMRRLMKCNKCGFEKVE